MPEAEVIAYANLISQAKSEEEILNILSDSGVIDVQSKLNSIIEYLKNEQRLMGDLLNEQYASDDITSFEEYKNIQSVISLCTSVVQGFTEKSTSNDLEGGRSIVLSPICYRDLKSIPREVYSEYRKLFIDIMKGCYDNDPERCRKLSNHNYKGILEYRSLTGTRQARIMTLPTYNDGLYVVAIMQKKDSWSKGINQLLSKRYAASFDEAQRIRELLEDPNSSYEIIQKGEDDFKQMMDILSPSRKDRIVQDKSSIGGKREVLDFPKPDNVEILDLSTEKQNTSKIEEKSFSGSASVEDSLNGDARLTEAIASSEGSGTDDDRISFETGANNKHLPSLYFDLSDDDKSKLGPDFVSRYLSVMAYYKKNGTVNVPYDRMYYFPLNNGVKGSYPIGKDLHDIRRKYFSGKISSLEKKLWEDLLFDPNYQDNGNVTSEEVHEQILQEVSANKQSGTPSLTPQAAISSVEPEEKCIEPDIKEALSVEFQDDDRSSNDDEYQRLLTMVQEEVVGLTMEDLLKVQNYIYLQKTSRDIEKPIGNFLETFSKLDFEKQNEFVLMLENDSPEVIANGKKVGRGR